MSTDRKVLPSRAYNTQSSRAYVKNKTVKATAVDKKIHKLALIWEFWRIVWSTLANGQLENAISFRICLHSNIKVHRVATTITEW